MKQGFYIPGLDGVRALSFAMVFVAHAGLSFVPAGLGVTVFFFLSGFLITTLLRREHESRGVISLRAFYIRRTLRIFPPFYVTYALILLLDARVCARGVSRSGGAIWCQLAYVSNYRAIFFGEADFPCGTNVLWSLAVEEHFYLLYPLVFLLLYKRLGRVGFAAVLAGASTGILAWRCVLAFVLAAPESRLFAATDTRIDSILHGCFLAVMMNPLCGDVRVSRLTRLFAGGAFALGLGASYALTLFGMPTRQAIGFTLQGVTMFPLFLFLSGSPDSAVVRALEVKPLSYVGELSYTLYLVHLTALLALAPWLGGLPVVRGACALGVSLGWSALVRLLVEEPVARVRQVLLRRFR